MKVGETAPDFTLKDKDGNDWKLSDQDGKTIVLLFYPHDNTPVCTAQMCAVRDRWAEYRETGAEIIGISTDSIESHKDFAARNNFPFTLLSDETGEVIAKYDVKSWIPGRSARAVVVIDKNGKIAYHKVQTISLIRPDDDEIIEAIKKAEKQ